MFHRFNRILKGKTINRYRDRIQELERLLLTYENEVTTLTAAMIVDTQKRYVLVTDDEYLKQVMPDNVLVIPESLMLKDAITTLQEMKPGERNKIELWLLKNVLQVPAPENVIEVINDHLFIKGQKMNHQQLLELRNQVKVIRRMRLWNIINETLKEKAKEMMTSKAQSFEDMRFGKMMIYTLETQNNILSIIERETVDEKLQKVVKLKQKA